MFVYEVALIGVKLVVSYVGLLVSPRKTYTSLFRQFPLRNSCFLPRTAGRGVNRNRRHNSLTSGKRSRYTTGPPHKRHGALCVTRVVLFHLNGCAPPSVLSCNGPSEGCIVSSTSAESHSSGIVRVLIDCTRVFSATNRCGRRDFGGLRREKGLVSIIYSKRERCGKAAFGCMFLCGHEICCPADHF